MRIKHIIVVLGLVGLTSQASFALTATYKHHFKQRHVMPMQSYKDAVVFKDVCTISQKSHLLDLTTQNAGRSLPNPCNPGWFNRISFSGGVNFDAGKWGNRNIGNPRIVGSSGQGYTGENTDKFSLNDAYLNILANINDWTSAFASLSYINASNFYSVAYQTTPNSLVVGDNNNQVNIQQAFIRVGNFNYSPVFVELGQQFQDFGRYELHPITESMTQSLTETLRTSLKVGVITPTGLSGSVYSFQDPVAKTVNGNKPLDYGASIGFTQPAQKWGYDIGAGYLYNIQGVNLVGNMAAYSGGQYNSTGVYHTRVGTSALYADLNYNTLVFSLRYTKALDVMSPLDVPQDNLHPNQGAKPWAASGQVTYGFNRWCKNQSVYAGYQASRQTVNFNLPRGRWTAGYSMKVLPQASVGAEWDHDIAYNVAQGGPTQGSSNLVSVRLGVTFG
jgi:hypothetical protein